MSLITLEEAPISVSRFSRVAVEIILDYCSSFFFNFLATTKKVDLPGTTFLTTNRQLKCELLIVKNIATATLEKRETDLGTSPRVARLIPSRSGSISSLYGAKTKLKAKKTNINTFFTTHKKQTPA